MLCCSKGALHTHVQDLVGDSHFTVVCCFTVEIHSILLYVRIYKYMQVYDRVMQMGGDFSMKV